MPAASKEPRYQLPTALASLVMGWETQCPGVLQAVEIEVGNGNWEKEEGLCVPPYSTSEAFQVACDTLEKHMLAGVEQHLIRKGPLLVRMGLSKPKVRLSDSQQAWLAQRREQAQRVLGQSQVQWVCAG